MQQNPVGLKVHQPYPEFVKVSECSDVNAELPFSSHPQSLFTYFPAHSPPLSISIPHHRLFPAHFQFQPHISKAARAEVSCSSLTAQNDTMQY